MLEAKCTACQETFVPADEDDTIHGIHEDGTECGGQGIITGEWVFRQPMTDEEADVDGPTAHAEGYW